MNVGVAFTNLAGGLWGERRSFPFSRLLAGEGAQRASAIVVLRILAGVSDFAAGTVEAGLVARIADRSGALALVDPGVAGIGASTNVVLGIVVRS